MEYRITEAKYRSYQYIDVLYRNVGVHEYRNNSVSEYRITETKYQHGDFSKYRTVSTTWNYQNIGISQCQNIKVSEYRNAYQNIELPKCQLVYRFSEISKCRNMELSKYRNT